MVSASNKMIIICVVLCCASSALCQIESNASDIAEGRTFGHHFLKRLSFAIIPTAFVVGVIMTLLAALTVVSIKGLGVGVVLLVIAVGQILARSFQAAPVAQYGAAPVPIVYQRQAEAAAPIWLEKDW